MSAPTEPPGYRARRDELLAAEHRLSLAIENVAACRRGLPLGGEVTVDYPFEERAGPAGPATRVTLSELFGGHDTLLLYSFMFSSEMESACPMCTSLIDGFDGAAPDVVQRAAFAVVASSPSARLAEYARERRWTNVRLVSSHGTSYNRDLGGEDASGSQRSRMNVFVRREGRVHHFYGTEKSASAPGQDDRHLDLAWPVWGLLDLTPDGRGDWRPNRPPHR